MRITKLVHSCMLVEADGRTALFDPGVMSAEAVRKADIERLDDIFITHEHPDHMDSELIRELAERFPEVRILAPEPAAQQLREAGLTVGSEAPDGAKLFESPHEHGEPLFSTPEQHGIHYLDRLTHPGDSHSFEESKSILALPVTAPWGATVRAVNLVQQLRPDYVIPIHDWHWSDEAREAMYQNLAQVLARDGIEFLAAQNGVAFEIG